MNKKEILDRMEEIEKEGKRLEKRLMLYPPEELPINPNISAIWTGGRDTLLTLISNRSSIALSRSEVSNLFVWLRTHFDEEKTQ